MAATGNAQTISEAASESTKDDFRSQSPSFDVESHACHRAVHEAVKPLDNEKLIDLGPHDTLGHGARSVKDGEEATMQHKDALTGDSPETKPLESPALAESSVVEDDKDYGIVQASMTNFGNADVAGSEEKNEEVYNTVAECFKLKLPPPTVSFSRKSKSDDSAPMSIRLGHVRAFRADPDPRTRSITAL